MKLRVFFAVFALFAISLLPAAAQKLIDSSDGYQLSLVLDHPDAVYAVGEEAVAQVTLTLNGKPADEKVIIVSSKDYYAPSKMQETVTLENGCARIVKTLDEPGFVHIRCNFKTPQGNTLSQMVGAGFDPLKIERSLPKPDDFDSYWAAQKELQAAIPLNMRVTRVDAKVAGVDLYDVQADCVAGNFSSYVAIPSGAQKGSLPAMVLCHGAGVAASRASVAAKWASEGIVVIDFNVHGLPNDQPREFYSNLYKGELKQYYLYDTSDRDSLFFRKMILRLLRAIDVVTAQEEWDGERLIVFGRSQGGAQALIGGGIDSRVDLVCAEIPALCDVTGYAAGRMAGWPKWAIIDAEGNITDETALNSIRYVDAINFVPAMKAKCYMTVGFIDVSCCATSVYAVFNEIPTEKHIYNHTTTGHRSTPEGDAYVRQAVLDYLQESGK